MNVKIIGSFLVASGAALHHIRLIKTLCGRLILLYKLILCSVFAGSSESKVIELVLLLPTHRLAL